MPAFAIYEPIAGLAVASLLRIAVGHSVLTVVGCGLCSVWCSVDFDSSDVIAITASGGAHGALRSA